MQGIKLLFLELYLEFLPNSDLKGQISNFYLPKIYPSNLFVQYNWISKKQKSLSCMRDRFEIYSLEHKCSKNIWNVGNKENYVVLKKYILHIY